MVSHLDNKVTPILHHTALDLSGFFTGHICDSTWTLAVPVKNLHHKEASPTIGVFFRFQSFFLCSCHHGFELVDETFVPCLYISFASLFFSLEKYECQLFSFGVMSCNFSFSSLFSVTCEPESKKAR